MPVDFMGKLVWGGGGLGQELLCNDMKSPMYFTCSNSTWRVAKDKKL